MKGEKTLAISGPRITRTLSTRDGKNGLVEVSVTAIRGAESKKTSFLFEIPNADRFVFPDDLGALIQCFGWAVAALGSELSPDPSAWPGCCKILRKVDRCLKDE